MNGESFAKDKIEINPHINLSGKGNEETHTNTDGRKLDAPTNYANAETSHGVGDLGLQLTCKEGHVEIRGDLHLH